MNGEQVMSITHPKLKTTLTDGGRVEDGAAHYPRLPRDLDDLEFFRRKVDTSEQVRGYSSSSHDDKARRSSPASGRSTIDLRGMWAQIQEITARGSGRQVKIYASGPRSCSPTSRRRCPKRGSISRCPEP